MKATSELCGLVKVSKWGHNVKNEPFHGDREDELQDDNEMQAEKVVQSKLMTCQNI